jgi:hypothetical protein
MTMTSERDFGARPVEDRPVVTTGIHTGPLTDEEMASIVRHRAAKAFPNRWHVGGPAGRTLYCGERFVGSTIEPEDANWLVTLANAENTRNDTAAFDNQNRKAE